jgi:parallel beta-helix repeat protein
MKSLFLLPVFLIWILPVNAGIVTVDDDGPADFSHIQDAINYSWDGDIIQVSPGTYPENLYYDSRAILLTSLDPNDPNMVESTIIQGTVTFNFNEGPDSILTGFTIAPASGDGVVCYGSYTIPVIEKNTITGCSTGIYCEFGAGPYVLNNTISNNSYGIQNCHGRIEGNTFNLNNQFGIFDCEGNVLNNQIIGNGHGVCNVTGNITGNTIQGNNLGIYSATGNISNNSITNNGSHGIGDITGDITGNTIKDNGASGIIDVSGNVINNSITDNGGGISGVYGKVENNIIAYNRGTGIDNCTGDIIDNHITFNQGDGLNSCNEWWESHYIYQNDISNNAGNGLSSCIGIIHKNTIKDNGGSGLTNCGTEIRDNTVSGNIGIGMISCSESIVHNIVTENNGGIHNCNAYVENNFIGNNQSDGINNVYQAVNNVIINNSGVGAADIDYGCENNLIVGNSSDGISLCSGDIINNTIAENLGHGIFECHGTVKNNIIAYNQGTGIYGQCNNSYNCLWRNTAGSFYNNYAKIGDQYINPLFAVLGIWTEGVWTKGNYRLLSEYGRWDDTAEVWIVDAQTSPCINAGDPDFDISYEPNPNGGRINMGYDGGTEHASMSDLPGPDPEDPPVTPALCVNKPSMDVNDDCKVDFADFSVFASQWLTCGLDIQTACWQ